MKSLKRRAWSRWGSVILATAVILFLGVVDVAAEESAGLSVYDEAAYTEYVESMMSKLDKLYLEFSEARGVDAPAAIRAEMEFLAGVHEMMKTMNRKFDSLDPKKGASLSPTETLVSIHAHTMLIDILAANQMEHMKEHPYIE